MALGALLVRGSDDGTGNWNNGGDGGDGSTVADAKIRHREGADADVSDGLEEDDHDADSESDAGDSICSADSEPSVGPQATTHPTSSTTPSTPSRRTSTESGTNWRWSTCVCAVAAACR
jgi:hypothetical protein